MSIYVPKCGDFIWIDYDPSLGHEIQKRRPALVISHHASNKLTGLALCVPVTHSLRRVGLEVVIKTKKVDGVAQPFQARFLDLRSRNPEYITKVSPGILEEVLEKLESMIGRHVEK